MQRQKTGHIEWFSYSIFEKIPYLRCGTFSRKGGASGGNFSSLNLSFEVGDDGASVEKNRQAVLPIIGASPLTEAIQVHGKEVAIVEASSPRLFESCDALITQEIGRPLVIKHADCQAALLYDPVHKAIGAVHAGWKGNVLNIYAETLAAMRAAFGTQPSDLLVSLSPSLGPEAAEFINYKTELPESFWDYQVEPYHFDLWAIAEEQLLSAGVTPDHLEMVRVCTYSNPSDFFSFRRNNTTGRHLSFIVLSD